MTTPETVLRRLRELARVLRERRWLHEHREAITQYNRRVALLGLFSETLEHRLCGLVRAEQEKRWLDENRDATASINAFIDRHGLLADRLRMRRELE